MSGDSGNIHRSNKNIHSLQERAMSINNHIGELNVSIKDNMLKWAKQNLDAHLRPDGNYEYSTPIIIGNDMILVTKNVINETYRHNRFNRDYAELMQELKSFRVWMPTMERLPNEPSSHKNKTIHFRVYRYVRKGKNDILVKCKDVGRTPSVHIMIKH